jgi:hypothetical protein
MELYRLTDKQLYTLHQSRYLAKGLSGAMNDEFNRRNLSADAVETLVSSFKIANDVQPQPDLWLPQKAFAFLVPFPATLQFIIGNKHLSTGQLKRWEQYWQYVVIGLAFRTGIFLVLVKLKVFNH